jgi:hypothetical protein
MNNEVEQPKLSAANYELNKELDIELNNLIVV